MLKPEQKINDVTGSMLTTLSFEEMYMVNAGLHQISQLFYPMPDFGSEILETQCQISVMPLKQDLRWRPDTLHRFRFCQNTCVCF